MSTSTTPTTNIDRLRADLLHLAEFGKNEEGNGVTRQAFTDPDTQSKRWLMEQFEELQVPVRLDGAGNVIARLGPADGACVAVGSHLDSVPNGGIFDGSLGVIAGLECVRTIKEHSIAIKRPLEVLAFADEEGRFGGMFGVEAIIGQMNPEFIQTTQDVEGIFLKDAMQAQGLRPVDALSAFRDPADFHAFLELHIEQGPVLEGAGIPIGIVNAISGVFKWAVRLIGRAAHAGTSPMHMRSDAFQGLAEFAQAIPRIIAEDGSDASRLTVGRVELKPGFAHTIPGEADFSLVGRDIDEEVMQELATSCRKALSAIARRHGLMFEFEQRSWLKPQACSERIVRLLEERSAHLELPSLVMPSGAGHDTQFMSQITEAGLIFLPSVDGISHAPAEWTHWNDVQRGADLLLDAVVTLCNE